MKRKTLKAMAAVAAQKEKEQVLAGKRAKFLPTDNKKDDNSGGYNPDGNKLIRIGKYFSAFRDKRHDLIDQLNKDAAQAAAKSGKSMTVGTDTAGGYTVPDEFNEVLLEKLSEIPRIANLVTTEPMAGLKQNVVVENASPTLSVIAEEADITATDGSFKQVVLDAYKLAGQVVLSNELLKFNQITPGVSNKIVRQMALQVAKGTDKFIMAGTGTSEPTGLGSQVATASTLNQVISGTDTFGSSAKADDLIKTVYSINSEYRANASWVMRDRDLQEVRLLKDTQNRYLWSDDRGGLNDRAVQGTLLGYPVYINNDIGDAYTVTGITASKATSIFFGDFSFMLLGVPRGEEGYDIASSSEAGTLWTKDQTSFRLITFRASNIGLPEAFGSYIIRGKA